MSTKKRMSLREYARTRHLAPSSVHKAIESGRISRGADGLLEAERADREWAANTRPRPGNGANGGHGASFLAARTRKETAQAGLSELELAARSGELILVADAAAMWESALGRMKSRWMGSISGSAHKIIGIKNLAQANAILETIVYDALAAGAEVGDEVERGDCG